MAHARRIAKNTFFLALGQLFYVLASLLLVIVLARLLPKADYGLYAFAFSLVNLIIIAPDFGFGGLIVRTIAKNPKAAGKLIGNVSGLKLLLSVAVFIASLGAAWLLGYSMEALVVIGLIAIYILLTSFTGHYRDVFKAHEQMHVDSLIVGVNRGLALVFSTLALLMGYGLVGVGLALVAAALITNLMALHLVKKRFHFRLFPEFDAGYVRDFMALAMPFLGIAFINNFAGSINPIILSLLLPGPQALEAVAVYAVPARVTEVALVVVSVLMVSLYPFMVRAYRQDRKLFARGYYLGFKSLYLLALPLAVGAWFLSDGFMGFFFPSAYRESAVVLSIMSFEVLFNFMMASTGRAIVAAGKEMKSMKFVGIAALTNVAVAVVLIPSMSYVGAALGALASAIVLFALQFWYCERRVVRLPHQSFFLVTLLACAPMAAFLYFFSGLGFPFQAAGAVALYALGLWAFKAVKPDEWLLFREVIYNKARKN